MAIFILTKVFGADRLKGDSPTLNSCFLEEWRRHLLLRWCLTSARVIPDLQDVTTCCAVSSAHPSPGSSTVERCTGPRHAREKGQTQPSSPFMHPLSSWAVCAFALPRAGAGPKCPGCPCPAAPGGSSAVRHAGLRRGEPLPESHTCL